MLLVTPSYWKDFSCLGSACTDNCCIGWEIDIDGETAERYRRLPGPLGERLRQDIDWGAGPSFRLKEERCAFLNQDNLCDLQLSLGEKGLCAICREHPRFYEWMGDRTEAGLGLCCEEAAALLLRFPFELEEREILGEPDSREFDPQLRDGLLLGRQAAFCILRDKSMPLTYRLAHCLSLAAAIQDAMDWGEDISQIVAEYPVEDILPPSIKADPVDFCRELLAIYKNLEPMDPGWPRRLEELSAELPELLSLSGSLDAFAYKQLALYWIYRYWMKSLFDGELLSRVKLVVCAVVVTGLLGLQALAHSGKVSLESQVNHLKTYSKEIEYNEENRLTLETKTWEDPLFSESALLGLLLER